MRPASTSTLEGMSCPNVASPVPWCLSYWVASATPHWRSCWWSSRGAAPVCGRILAAPPGQGSRPSPACTSHARTHLWTLDTNKINVNNICISASSCQSISFWSTYLESEQSCKQKFIKEWGWIVQMSRCRTFQRSRHLLHPPCD